MIASIVGTSDDAIVVARTQERRMPGVDVQTFAKQVGEFALAISARVDGLESAMNARFDAVEKRLDGVEKRLDGVEKHLDMLDQRFDRLERRFDRLDAKIDRLLSPAPRRSRSVRKRR